MFAIFVGTHGVSGDGAKHRSTLHINIAVQYVGNSWKMFQVSSNLKRF